MLNIKLNKISVKKLEFFTNFVGVTSEQLTKLIMEEALEVLNQYICNGCEIKFVSLEYNFPVCPDCGKVC